MRFCNYYRGTMFALAEEEDSSIPALEEWDAGDGGWDKEKEGGLFDLLEPEELEALFRRTKTGLTLPLSREAVRVMLHVSGFGFGSVKGQGYCDKHEDVPNQEHRQLLYIPGYEEAWARSFSFFHSVFHEGDMAKTRKELLKKLGNRKIFPDGDDNAEIDAFILGHTVIEQVGWEHSSESTGTPALRTILAVTTPPAPPTTLHTLTHSLYTRYREKGDRMELGRV
jgi:hypothetical protein